MASQPEYDYVIVGGGVAGLVLAARLSEDPTKTILVLEAGEDQTNDPRLTTPALWPTLLGTSSDWALRTVPQPSLGDREISVPQGRVLGGSSGLNGLAFTASSKANIDAWAELGNPGWDWSTLIRFMKRSYTLTTPSAAAVKQFGLEYLENETEKLNGPVQLSFPEEPNNIWPRAWIDTLTGLGFPVSKDPFTGKPSGPYVNAETVHPVTRQRSFAANTYLEMTKGATNLNVSTNSLVEKVIIDQDISLGPVATGVQYSKDGARHVARAKRDVLLCAGTLSSSKILELSGIGGEKILKEHGIDTIVDNPNVGENLQNHPLACLSFEVSEGLETMDPLSRQEPNALAAAMEAYAKQSGPFANSGTYASAMLPLFNDKLLERKQDIEQLLGAHKPSATGTFGVAHEKFVRSVLSSPDESSGCLIAFPGYALFNPDGSMAQALSDNYFSVAVLLSYPLSSGSTHLSSNSPSSKPSIDPRYLSNPLDLEILARHVQFADTHVIRAEPLKGLLKPSGKRIASQPASMDDLEAVKDYIRRNVVGAYHFTGTCSMMPREKGGVVDAQLKVYECRHLRVCDASVIPITTSRNPQATVYAVAEYAAELIKELAARDG